MERDQNGYDLPENISDFNSHAHVERDCYFLDVYSCGMISTHTLTWSVTATLIGKYNAMAISTHTLTWSVTCCRNFSIQPLRHFNSHAHVERDCTTDLARDDTKNFNSHAHVERDEVIRMFDNRLKISTHTLTWSVTYRPFPIPFR